MSLTWDDQLDGLLSQSSSESSAVEVAEACRTESDSDSETPSVWWAPLLKSHLSSHASSCQSRCQPINVVSACCGCCSEAECLQAGSRAVRFALHEETQAAMSK